MHFHTVLFQFHDDIEPGVIEEVLEKLRGMEAIPAVRSIVVGPNLMPVVDGWTHGMTMVFDSPAAMMEDFAPHPLHQAVVEHQIPLFKHYLAMDPAPAPPREVPEPPARAAQTASS